MESFIFISSSLSPPSSRSKVLDQYGRVTSQEFAMRNDLFDGKTGYLYNLLQLSEFFSTSNSVHPTMKGIFNTFLCF